MFSKHLLLKMIQEKLFILTQLYKHLPIENQSTFQYQNFLFFLSFLQRFAIEQIIINMINNKQNKINQNASRISNTSESLQIIEPQDRIVLTSQSSIKISGISNQADDDILNYSNQQPSLSLNVVQQQDLRGSINLVLQENQPTKRKRRQIFAKYKKNAQEILVQQELGQSRKFQETLQQVFSSKDPAKQDYKPQVQKRRFQKFTKRDQVLQINAETSKMQPQHTVKSRLDQIQKLTQNSRKSNQSPSSKKSVSQQSSYQKKQNQNDFSEIPFRISEIKAVEGHLDESQQIQNMLESPIFNGGQQIQNISNPPNNQKNSIEPLVEQRFIKVNTIQTHDVKTPIHKAIISNAINNLSPTQSERQNAQQYEKIDITQQSINNSIMIRGNNFYPTQGGLNFDRLNFNHLNHHQQQHTNRSPKISVTYNRVKSPNNAEIKLGAKSKQIRENQSFSDRSEQTSYQKQIQTQQKVYEESRIPMFLQKARKANSYYPNFYHPNASNRQDQQNIRLEKLVYQFDSAISFLQKMAIQIIQKDEQSKQAIKRLENGFRLDYFLNSGWQKISNIERLEQLKPRNAFSKRVFNFNKVLDALESYKKIVQYYRGVKLNLADQRGRQKLISIRKKFWSVEWNIRIISEDLYVQTMKFDFPQFYHECLDFLKRPFPRTITKNAIAQIKYLNGKFLNLKHQKDPLANSQIGNVFKDKLQREMKFLCPY